jgi:hypothetical protein
MLSLLPPWGINYAYHLESGIRCLTVGRAGNGRFWPYF